MIKPTIGRRIWFWPNQQIVSLLGMAYYDFKQPLDAGIAFVHSDTQVNLSVADQHGQMFGVTAVPIRESGPVEGQERFFAQWMPYQVNAAAKDAAPTASDSTDSATEREIVAKGLTAPRVTPKDIASNIDGEYYFTADKAVQANMHDQDELTRLTGAHGELRLLTFCVLRLKNGFTVTGESACASPENFDAEVGRKIARANAEQKIWPLMGYELRSKLSQTHNLWPAAQPTFNTEGPDDFQG